MIGTLLLLAGRSLRHIAVCITVVALAIALLAVAFRWLGIPIGLAMALPEASPRCHN